MIDWVQVEQLREDMGETFVELLALFQAEVAEALDKLDTAETPASVADTAHFLKGAALNLGMREMASLCASAETAARAGDMSVCDPVRIRALFTESQQALCDGLARRAA